jgi:DNA-directed RNA polymerase subunit K/omega
MKGRELFDTMERVGGVFKFSVLMQKRIRELVLGAQPLIDGIESDDPKDVALAEIEAGLIELSDPLPAAPPAGAEEPAR